MKHLKNSDPLPDEMSYAESMGPAMAIESEADAEADAEAYFNRLVDRYMRLDATLSLAAAESLTRTNLGYYAGYYSLDTRRRVERLFKCAHPCFGSVETHRARSVNQ